MLTRKMTLVNKLGLHARAAMKLTNLASRYQSEIKINYQDKEVDAKSIMCVMVLAISCGTELQLNINGEDETEAMDAITQLISDKFGESE